jgi:hypothetical protein
MSNMRFAMPFAISAVVATASSAAFGASYTGNYLLTFTDPHPTKGKKFTECLNLTDDGSVLGYPHSGEVAFNGGTSGPAFFVAGNLLIVTVIYDGDNSLFIAKIAGGVFTSGALFTVQNGIPVSAANMKVGALGSC